MTVVLVDGPGKEVCDKLLIDYIKTASLAPYLVLLVDFSKTIAGGEKNFLISDEERVRRKTGSGCSVHQVPQRAKEQSALLA